MNYQELIEQMRVLEIDHEPNGWPAIQMRDISAMCDAIESLLAENERLNAEIDKYHDAPVVAYRHLMEDGWEYFDAPTGDDCPKCVPLIVKPGNRNARRLDDDNRREAENQRRHCQRDDGLFTASG